MLEFFQAWLLVHIIQHPDAAGTFFHSRHQLIPVGEAFRVTSFRNPGLMIPDLINFVEISLQLAFRSGYVASPL